MTTWRSTLLLSVLVLSACTHENPLALQLQGNLTMVRLAAGEGVTGQCYPDGETVFRPNGVFDIMVSNRYEFFPSVENMLVPLESINGVGPQTLQMDPQTVMLEGAQVTLELDTTTAGPLKPASGTPPWRVSWFSPFVAQIKPESLIGSRFTLIPSDVGEAMRTVFGAFPGRRTARQQAIVKVRVVGRMADGTVIESNTLPYPVDICWGCLVSLPVAIEGVGVDPEQQYQICSSKRMASLTLPCMPGNDEIVPCQFYCFLCDQDNSCDDTICPSP